MRCSSCPPRRRWFFVASLCATWCLMLLAPMAPPAEAASSSRPNIVLVMADDQGWGDMAYNGHPALKTPNFDLAAKECLRLDRFYAAAPVCSPTRASVMTGRHPNRMGVFKWGYPMRPQETTIAEALKQAGYVTAHFGKWHLGSVRNASPAHPGANGFDYWLSAPNFYDNDAVLSLMGKAVQTQGESSIVAADAAIEWMKQQGQGEAPFLAVIWFGSPHSPHRAVEEDLQWYADSPKPLQHFYGEITGMDRAYGKIRAAIKSSASAENTILWYCSDNGALPRVGSTGGHRGNKGNVYEGGLLVPAIVEWPARIKAPRSSSVRCNTCDIYPTLLELVGVQVEKQAPLDGVSLVSLFDGELDARPRGMGFWDYTAPGIGTPSAQWMGDLLKTQQAGGDLEPHISSQRAAELPNPPLPTDKWPGHAAWVEGDWKLHRIEPGAANANSAKNGAKGKAKQANAKQGQAKQGKGKGKGEARGVTWELYNLASDAQEGRNLYDSQPEVAQRLAKDLESWLGSVANSLNGKDY
ncbi:MAG: sulfatase-like hydrolase/transferase [Planctomycetales bacterium]|nr:sulfatase-like hydrolase/transferase [Planctomycetales bacterium]